MPAWSPCACKCCKILSACVKGRVHVCRIRPVLTVYEGRMVAGRQPSAKPPSSHLVLGDGRLQPFASSYSQDFHPPLPGNGKLRSPLRSKEARQPHQLLGLYRSAMQRIGECVLLSALQPHMRSARPGHFTLAGLGHYSPELPNDIVLLLNILGSCTCM